MTAEQIGLEHTLTVKYLRGERMHLSECSCGDWCQYSPSEPPSPHTDHEFHVALKRKKEEG